MENQLYKIEKDILETKTFNIPLLQEAMRQAELRTQDENDRKNRIDTRAYQLMAFYTSMLGLIVAGKLQITTNVKVIIALIFGSLIFMALKLLRPKKYSPLGTMPLTWLDKAFFTGYDSDQENQSMFGHVLTHVLVNIQKSLSATVDSNNKRAELLDKVLGVSVIAILPIFYLLLN